MVNWVKRPRVSQKSYPHQRSNLGLQGEQIASSYLRKQNFRILEHNFKARYGEIDIIALDGNTLVFVEVKTRTSRVYGTPEDAITPKKLREIAKTAQYYRLRHPEFTSGVRIDVIAIEMDRSSGELRALRHLRNVTS